MDSATLTALALTLRVAVAATALVVVPCTLIAYALARYEFRGWCYRRRPSAICY